MPGSRTAGRGAGRGVHLKESPVGVGGEGVRTVHTNTTNTPFYLFYVTSFISVTIYPLDVPFHLQPPHCCPYPGVPSLFFLFGSITPPSLRPLPTLQVSRLLSVFESACVLLGSSV